MPHRPLLRSRPLPPGAANASLLRQMRRRAAVRAGIIGWSVIVAAIFAWEAFSLVARGDYTLSRFVRDLMTPAWGRAAVVVVWLLLGFGFFAPQRPPHR